MKLDVPGLTIAKKLYDDVAARGWEDCGHAGAVSTLYVALIARRCAWRLKPALSSALAPQSSTGPETFSHRQPSAPTRMKLPPDFRKRVLAP
jgi:hypothetical protein